MIRCEGTAASVGKSYSASITMVWVTRLLRWRNSFVA